MDNPDDLSLATFVVLSRIYDVLMADLTIKNSDMARKVLEAHLAGKLLGAAPQFDGDFGTHDD